jgi:hypothetical protein
MQETDELSNERAAFLDPDQSFLDDGTTTLVKVVEEMTRLRAAGRHYKSRAVIAEARAATAEERANDLQRRLNERLADEADDLPAVFANCDR